MSGGNEYDVNTPGFLDLPSSKVARQQAGKVASGQGSKQARRQDSKASSGYVEGSKPPQGRKRKQLSLKGFDPELHKAFAIAAQKEEVPMVRIAEDLISEWLEREGYNG